MQSLYNYGPDLSPVLLAPGEGPHRESEIVLGVWHMISSLPVTSSGDNNNPDQPKYHGDHQHPAQFEFMTLIINKEARYGGRIRKEQMKNMLPFWDHSSFHSPAPCVVCAECYWSYTWLGINVTGLWQYFTWANTDWERRRRGQNETLWANNWN